MESGQGKLVPVDSLAETALELPYDELKVEGQAAESLIRRVSKALTNAQFRRDDRRPGQVRVVDGAALKSVRQRIADRDEPVHWLANPASRANRDADPWIGVGRSRLHAYNHVGRCFGIAGAVRNRYAHGAPLEDVVDSSCSRYVTLASDLHLGSRH